MRLFLPYFVLLLLPFNLIAQNSKPSYEPSGKTYDDAQRSIIRKAPVSVPDGVRPFGLPQLNYQPIPYMLPVKGNGGAVRRVMGDQGLPIAFYGKTDASFINQDNANEAQQALRYLASLQLEAIKLPLAEFLPAKSHQDEQGNYHVRLEQYYNGVPVYGAELIAHSSQLAFHILNGRYFPTPKIQSVTPVLNAAEAIGAVMGMIKPKAKTFWTPAELKAIGGKPYDPRLVIYHVNGKHDAAVLAWQVTAYPTVLRREVYFIDANTGALLHSFDYTCKIDGGRCTKHAHHNEPTENEAPHVAPPPFNPPPATGTGADLFGVTRSFGIWESSPTSFYMEDASKQMFDPAASNMPSDPSGAIVTLDAKNTSPANQNFSYTIVTSTAKSFNNPRAVSAHWNSIKSYDYFEQKHGRLSIDGVRGNILAFVNVADDDGSAMENAFWNGAAMWYGNGGSTFRPLARGLDVGGHEMSHGVIEKTANLEYQNESGALNESFADVFGAMIDNDDWQIGEDVMQPGASLSGALRSLSDPHNGYPTNGAFWQPKHVNEQYKGSQDNGGVHINSGIPNHAFYLFASNAAVGKDRAEKVYYKALRDYLVKSSKFVDCRIAVIQAAQDLYGSTVANAAAAAFTAVGIGGSSQPTNYLGQLAPNPGEELLLATTNDDQNIQVAGTNGTIFGNLYVEGLQSRPSMRDDGREFVFVDADGHIVDVFLDYVGSSIEVTSAEIISPQPIWRRVALSKDGRFLAATTDNQDNFVTIIDYGVNPPVQRNFRLYNPTYTQGQITGDVRYADVFEFDYSGEYLMYDAYNEFPNGQALAYWDIGFLRFFENGKFADANKPFISKLFNGLPENSSIGNPAFSKNSPYIISFDFIDESTSPAGYDIYGANIETGDYDRIVADNQGLGWPNYNRTDNILYYERPNGSTTNIRQIALASSKIKAQGTVSTQLIAGRHWPVAFANGSRSLKVNTKMPARELISALKVSPNPTTDRCLVRFQAKHADSAQILLLNAQGAAVQQFAFDILDGDNQFDLDLSTLPSGVYVLRLQSQSGNAATAIVKK